MRLTYLHACGSSGPSAGLLLPNWPVSSRPVVAEDSGPLVTLVLATGWRCWWGWTAERSSGATAWVVSLTGQPAQLFKAGCVGLAPAPGYPWCLGKPGQGQPSVPLGPCGATGLGLQASQSSLGKMGGSVSSSGGLHVPSLGTPRRLTRSLQSNSACLLRPPKCGQASSSALHWPGRLVTSGISRTPLGLPWRFSGGLTGWRGLDSSCRLPQPRLS